MNQPDILEKLEDLRLDDIAAVDAALDEAADIITQLRQRIFDMADQLETWRNAFEAERQDHEATMKAWDEERSGAP
jgi:phage shock protein A